jgi:hypothetical protein
MSEYRTITHKGITYRLALAGLVSQYLLKREPDILSPLDEGQVERATKFLRECTKRSDRKRGYSYVLKHTAEDYAGDYVSNGALIEAALRLGYRVVPEGWYSPNAYVYLRVDKAVRR